MILNAETPMNRPSSPPQLATKSDKVYDSVRFTEIKLFSLNDKNSLLLTSTLQKDENKIKQ